MDFTGERYVPEIGGEIRQEHLHRYALAANYVSGLRVLDMACGEGYGSAHLATSAAHVTGVDISDSAVAHARQAYGDRKGLEFLVGSAASLPLEDASVDVVVSFETIEHHTQHEEMMAEFLRVLRPGGLLIMSSPNKKVYSDEAGYQNEFHVKELYFDELDALARRYFRHVTYLGQRFATGSIILPLEGQAARRQTGMLDLWTDDGVEAVQRVPRLESSMYFVLLARNGEVPPPLVRPSLLLSEAADLYLEFKRVARWASGVHEELVASQTQARQVAAQLRQELSDIVASGLETAGQLDEVRSELLELQAQKHQLSERLAEQHDAAEQAQEQLRANLRLAEQTHLHQLQALRQQLDAQSQAAEQLAQAHAEASRGLQESQAAIAQQREEMALERQRAAAHIEHVQASHAAEVGDLVAARNHTAHLEALARAEVDRLKHDLQQAHEAGTARAEQDRLLRVKLEGDLAAARAQMTEMAGAAALALSAQAEEAAAERRETGRVWRRRVTSLRWQARQKERHLARALASQAAHAEALQQALAAQRSSAQRRQRVMAERLRLAEVAHAQARAEAAARAHGLEALVMALQQRAHQSEKDWTARLEELNTRAAQLATAAASGLRRQHAEMMYRSELASLLARNLLDERQSVRHRLATPWRAVAGWVDAAAEQRYRSWGELAVETLGTPVDTVPVIQGIGDTEPFTIDMSNQPLAKPKRFRSVDDLLLLDDRTFVQAAYQTLLGRQPDAEGQNHYLDALLRGEPRLQVLHDLRHSDEGQAREPELLGLEEAMLSLRRSRLPLIGRLFRKGTRPPEALGLRRKVETLTDELGRSQARVDERLLAIERLLQRMKLQAEQQAQAVVLVSAMGRYQWPPETDLWRAAQQLAEAPSDRFVNDVFGFTLGRAPHGYELMHFREQLSMGTSRALLLDKILFSPEFGRDHPSLGAPAAQSAPQQAALPPPGPGADATLPSLPIHQEPVVSVIVPIYGKLDYTLRCLRSIAMHRPAVPFEVIVVDDCSPDDSAEVLEGVQGIRLERNAKNLGFIRSCNRGAALAKGTHVLFLNNDTEVHPHWLDELYRTFEIFPGTGLVGSKLIYPDGTLQEAGGIIWSNGNAWNFGRGQDPALPVYNYAREVDYCSGASIMLPKSLFDELGGFDELYLPAYCEDSDLALKVRDRGLRVIYQPTSVVVHHEGITSGTDTGSGVKSYQVANAKKLYERWKGRLATHQADAQNPDEAKDRTHQMRVLVLEHCTPTPDQDAGSVSVFNMLLLLREMGFQVTFIAEDNFLYMPDYTVMLQRAGIEVLYGPYVTSVKQHVQEQGSRYDLVYLFRPVVVERHIETIRTFCPQAKVLFYTHDIHHIRMEREAALLPGAGRESAAAAMKEREFKAIRSVDATIVVSTAEMEILQPQLPDQALQILPLLLNVPGSQRGYAERQGLIFVGGYQHTPNVDAVLYFVGEVMPLVRKALPGVVFHVVGSKPPPEILALAAPDVVVHGFVEDIGPLLDKMRVSVAPLRYGAGVKGKVGTALAAGLPTVATPIAAEGMGVMHGDHLLVGATSEELSACIVRLYNDRSLWERIATSGLEFAGETWGPAASFRMFSNIVQQLGLPTRRSSDGLVLYQPASFRPPAPTV